VTRKRRRRRAAKERVPPGKVILGVVASGVLVAVGVSLSLGPARPELPTEDPDEAARFDERVRVEVLNLGGVSGMGRDATEAIREAGFDVVELGNVVPFDAAGASQVIDRVGRTDIAQAVAMAVGIDNVQSDPDPNLYVEVSVLLGRDWVGVEGIAGNDHVIRPSSWWNPRTWFGR
jgi:hypothetical protein